MTLYLINYDLISPGQDYESVIAYIKSLGGYAEILRSTWAVTSSKTALQIVNEMSAISDKNDKFYVVDITSKPAAFVNLPQNIVDWLQS
ncbi:MAG: hypothetical protein JWN36_521 [Microbacteriaceae bacterium]|nr:hypothetical protein [Microbacteriaceae bacterium]